MRFILCGQPHSIIPDETRRIAVIADRVSDSFRSFSHGSNGLQRLKAWGDLFRQISDIWWDVALFETEQLTSRQIDEAATNVVDRINMRKSLQTIYEANFDFDWSGTLSKIETRTLVLELGTPEEIQEYGLQGEQLTALLSNSEWRVLDGADVATFFELPRSIVDFIERFLEEPRD